MAPHTFWTAQDPGSAPHTRQRPALPEGVGLQVPDWALQDFSARPRVGTFEDQFTGLVSPLEEGSGVDLTLAARAQGGEDLYAYNTFF